MCLQSCLMMMDYRESLDLLAAPLILHQLWLSGTVCTIVWAEWDTGTGMCARPHVVALLYLRQHKRFRPDRQQISDPEKPQSWPESGLRGLSVGPLNLASDRVHLLCFICRFDLLIYCISDFISDRTRQTWATSRMPCRTSCQFLWNDSIWVRKTWAPC